jgi:ketosteroid isomerase-like protein
MKQLSLILLLATSAYFACAPNAEKEPPKKAPVVQTTDSSAIKVALQMFEHFNKHDWAKMTALYSDPAEFKDPSLGTEIVKMTREETAKKYTELQGIFADVHDQVLAVYPSGDKHVVVEFVSTGTAPDGTKFKLPICTVFTIENGLITKDFTYYDNSQGE